MGAGFLLGCLIAVVIGASVSFAARGVVTFWPEADTAGERLADLLLAATCVAIALVQALGFAGAFRLGPVLVAAVSCGALGAFWTARARRRSSLGADLRHGLRALLASPPLLAAALLGLFLAQRGLALPELSWDGLTYHLTYPGFWLQHGGFGRFEAGGVWEQYESFPKGGEALFALAMLPFHSDFLVHAVNVPLWAGIGISVRATALRLGAKSRAADVSALLVLGCPALSAYVSPAYVEVPMTFAFCVALGAAARALVSRDSGALTPVWLALGLAAAIKTTALAYLPLGVLATLFALRDSGARACTRPLALGVWFASAVAAPWYVNNAVQCENPLYPAGLPGVERGPAAGTLANVWAVRETSVLSQAAIGDVLDHLAAAPWKVRYPLGPGWLFLGASCLCVVLTAGSFVRARKHAQQTGARLERQAAILAALALALSLLYALSPWNGVFREANTRFLMPATIAAVISIAVCSSQLPRWSGHALAGLGIAWLIATLGTARFVRDGVVDPWAAVSVLCLASAAIAVQLALTAPRRLQWVAAGAIGFALSVGAGYRAAQNRDERRADAYAHAVDLHPISGAPDLWKHVDALPASRIAFAVGDVNATEGWFFYPLFGAQLQHEVRYVDIETWEGPACTRRGLIRDQPNEAAWRARLLEKDFEYLVVAGRPLELEWARRSAATFRLTFESNHARGFRIERQVLISQ
jgi:4-amino-4-deoxy-L-arabinose transferase-like glycosyltransferase